MPGAKPNDREDSCSGKARCSRTSNWTRRCAAGAPPIRAITAPMCAIPWPKWLRESTLAINMEAGSKMAAAMKEVIGAAAGLSVFYVPSARDLVPYMVRRNQMLHKDEAEPP